ncbi:hypothetical protein [Pectobacterium brasiliense]|uniref:hypothetical protein n=1 Tax=Pectobacterium brasiliense TaxID=180957 RepID=UPI001968A782|nr:hypothetical protein [Pectobacterium brasiliense]
MARLASVSLKSTGKYKCAVRRSPFHDPDLIQITEQPTQEVRRRHTTCTHHSFIAPVHEYCHGMFFRHHLQELLQRRPVFALGLLSFCMHAMQRLPFSSNRHDKRE